MAHDHGHAHKHEHDHHAAPSNFNTAFMIAILLNSLFVITEFFYGWVANSTALMADAGHNLSDVLGLLLAWGAALLSRKAPTSTFTYGLRSSSILAALANAIVLLVACGAIAWEAIQRFSEPPVVAGKTVIIVALIGIAINSISAWLFAKGSKGDLNIKGAFLHLAADAVVSLGVVISGFAILWTGWFWIDPAVSLMITLVIIVSTWGLLRQSAALALGAVPSHIRLIDIEAFLRQLDGVTGMHDLHVWAMSTTENAMTVHLVMPHGGDNAFLDKVSYQLKEKFSINHVAIQIEYTDVAHCCTLNLKGDC